MNLTADFTHDAWNFFLHLAEDPNQPAAFINTERYVICSASPELFFSTRWGHNRLSPHEGIPLPWSNDG